MKIIASLVAVLAIGTGVLAGAAAYQSAGPASQPVGVQVARQQPAAPVVPGTSFRWAPCEAPAVLRDGVCVTEVTRTVTLPAPAPVAPAPVPSGYDDGDDEGYSEDDEYDEDDDYDEDPDESHDEDESQDEEESHDGEDD